MNKGFISNLVFAIFAALCICACGSDDENGNNAIVEVGNDGKTSNGSIFSVIDDANFYLDYIKYTIKEGHLVVSGYDKGGFKGNANIVKAIRYKGSTYEVRRISYGAFQDCTGLTSINIPNSVTEIGGDAFENCTRLTSVTLPNSLTYLTGFRGCTGLTAINIADGLTKIGDEAFYGCTGLTSINIPNSVTEIGYSVFAGCTSLTAIHCKSKQPYKTYVYGINGELFYPTFDNSMYSKVTLYIPSGSRSAYASAYPWKYFVNVVEE